MQRIDGGWSGFSSHSDVRYLCGWCGDRVTSTFGADLRNSSGIIAATVRVCPACNRTSYLELRGPQVPRFAAGSTVPNLPSDLEALYEEARRCTAHDAFTAAVLVLRKLLMSIAADKGAAAGLGFVEYVDYLEKNGYIPKDARPWVDHIRQRGNEANHEIHLMQAGDARELIDFTQMLLTIMYDFPSRIPKSSP